MHTFGHPVKIDELADICREWHIELVEDAAESIGSFYKGYHTGTFGKVGAISFNGNKTITTGGGGMLLFQDEELGAYAKHGRDFLDRMVVGRLLYQPVPLRARGTCGTGIREGAYLAYANGK